MRIRWKVTLSALLAVTLGLAVAGWLALRSLEQIELAHLQESLEIRAQLALYVLAPTLQRPDSQEGALRTLARELAEHSAARVTVIDASGAVLADSMTPDEALRDVENHLGRPEIDAALAGRRGTDVRLSQTVGTRLAYVALPVGAPDGRIIAVVRLAVPLTELDARIGALEQTMALAFGLAFAIAMALSVLLGQNITRPFSHMVSVARNLAAGSLGERIAVTASDEIGMLAASFNHMADRLESTIRDVTEDRAQLLAVLTSMVEGVMVLDCVGRVLQVNPALERMFLLRGGASRGRFHGEVIGHQEFHDLVAAVLQTRRHFEGEISAGGRTLHIQASVTGSQRENEPCVILVFHDVTALRRLENVRKDFVANVSHEIRTPLTSIKGYVEAMLDDGLVDREAALRFLRIVLTQADRLNLILDDLLQLSQIESGQVRFKEEAVSLQSVVDRTLAVIKPMADKKGHRVTVDIPPTVPAVLADEARLAQVMTNLLDNAVKYTPDHGQIHITARPAVGLAADAMAGPASVEVCVADTGIGIPEPDRPRVFERFYRVDKARSRELGGTGLGLAIVKHIVEGHQGQIWVEANTPRGSRFVFRLPAVRQPMVAADR